MPALTPGDALPQPDKVGHERHGEFVTALVAERSRGPGRGERAVGRRSARRPDIGTMAEAIARSRDPADRLRRSPKLRRNAPRTHLWSWRIRGMRSALGAPARSHRGSGD